MHSLRGMRRLLAGLALAALSIAFIPGSARALPWPGAKDNHLHFGARSVGAIYINRVFMGIVSRGQVGADSSGAGTIQGGYWPRGSVDNYVYGSGLEVAGVIDGVKSASNPWGGDTTMGKFEDPIGSQQHGSEVTKIYNSVIPDDNANWPAYAFVAQGDSSELLFDPLLRGRLSASQGDVEFIAWDGDPAFNSGRVHPLGIMSEYRVMGWNYPSGNQDIVYLIMTLYNVTSTNAADYASIRPSMQAIALQQAATFQTLNNAKFGITLPAGGYTIDSMVAAVANDDDVGNENRNYASVNLPLALKYTYAVDFNKGKVGWRFDPAIFGSPFFAGVGFVGVKILAGPPDGRGVIGLFTNSTNGTDPGNGQSLYRVLSAQPAPGLDGALCSLPGTPSVTHVCFLRSWTGTPTDIRSYASSPRFNLNAGKAGTFVAAFIFAAPVAIPGFVLPSGSGNGIVAGNPTWLEFADSMTAHNASGFPGVNTIDSLAGFLSYNGGPGPHVPTADDFHYLSGSLYGKAQVAQQVFNHQFLLPFSPDPPAFFLIPGDKQVTILWKPSAAETGGDPFFAVASAPNNTTAQGVQANALYDPNYRQFDVEGYRIYRGRSDAPSALHLLAQFDYAGTTIKDFGGIFQVGNCAPELNPPLTADCPGITKITPGVTSTVGTTYDINQATNSLIQVDYGNRTPLAAAGQLIVLSADTAITGGGTGFPPLSNTGVPFVFIDKAGTTYCSTCGTVAPPVNGITYFYSVTAFDFNSLHSGPSSLESPRATKAVLVGAPASNFDNSSVTSSGTNGRHGLLTDATIPSIDAGGKFSKAFPPSNAASVALAGFATQVIKGSGSAAVQFDSTQLTAIASAGSKSIIDWYTVKLSSGSVVMSIPMSIGFDTVTKNGNFNFNGALSIATDQATIYGGGAGYTIPGAFTTQRLGSYWTGNQGRGCANSVYGQPAARSQQCYYGGPRWFSGSNETTDNPGVVSPITVNAPGSSLTTCVSPCAYNNAGTLPGVVTVHVPQGAGYLINAPWRDVESGMSSFVSAADYKLYWGTGGVIDSVIDVTHDEPVPFKPTVGASWGVLNSQATPTLGGDARPELTATDITCVPPLRNFSVTDPSASPYTACTSTYALENTARPGPIVFFVNALANAKTEVARPNNGFMLYLKGRIYMFELTGGAVPAAGTVWTARDYVGIVYGGNGPAGDEGAYAYVGPSIRPFNAPGSSVAFAYTVNNAQVATTADALDAVHTVPDPYYVTSAFDKTVVSKVISFVKVPVGATIRIYSSSGVLIRVLQNTSTTFGGTVNWDVRNRSNQYVASGVYFYNVEAGGVSKTKRMVIVNFASNVQ